MSHTSKPGKLEPLAEDENSQEIAEPDKRTVPLLIVIAAIVALVLAVVVATQVLGVLYVMIFPPTPPLPADVTLVSHVNSDYGVDEWLYNSDQTACEVVAFYNSVGGKCRLAPYQCANPNEGDSFVGESEYGQHVARCVGQMQASIFAMRWQAIIATGPTKDIPTQYRLTREMYWTGQVPPMSIPENP